MKQAGRKSKPSTRRAPDARALELAFGTPAQVERVLARGTREALQFHKRLGNPVYALKNGKVVKVSARSIRIPPAR
jgi:hypothetical protein